MNVVFPLYRFVLKNEERGGERERENGVVSLRERERERVGKEEIAKVFISIVLYFTLLYKYKRGEYVDVDVDVDDVPF